MSKVFPRYKHTRCLRGSYAYNGGMLTTRNDEISIEKVSNVGLCHLSLLLHR